MGLRAGMAVLLGIFGPSLAFGGSEACLQAAHDAASRHQVPVAVLVTIARAESGRGPDRRPWPWTMNAAGHGKYFATRDAALAEVRARRAKGETNLDIGCFQLNFRWHGHAFVSLDQMFDPARNADHAARFLRDLFHETGDWKTAAGAYHSRRAQYAETYVAGLERIFAGTPRKTLPDTNGPAPAPAAPPPGPGPAPNLLTSRPPLALVPVRPLSGAGA